ncbi:MULTISPECIES: NAD-dependent epimerase/dehydratase family protein [Vibrio]|uniref:NAD-dependent epimerase/dehydratase family protein n=1 Tax=Vibrio TaxID=662 RepID=UPI001A8D80A0|nr:MULTISPECIES: NAD(P)-dependent oxidoreductase [Vibrio]MBO0198047.1 NAD(P)-dependent oxidoreductase [Vibrio alginolyticus]MCR9641848.1 NAD(P)-dependent oxidoreductase [Vibrio alginolyticus]MDW1579713.1 NAD(P)-dependent oxidoreductase [Vibrio sp. Vb2897]MDW1585868.1 NAD(P)-dependent oxidoreductase [Vibrio sp. Vb2910]MDW1594835.1 NAD(P)-dependent oxidoreductase [Vibrio sp. Vb2911]
MKVLIFGVTGNSGRYTAKFYLNKGYEVFGVGRSSTIPKEIEGVNYIQGDIQDIHFYNSLPTDIDLVVNFAGIQPSIITTSENTDLDKTLRSYVDVNISGVFNILEFVRKSKIPTYIYTTTHRDYELHWENNKLLGNDLPLAINYQGDHTMYAISKTSAKMMGDYYGECFGIRVFNLRLPMMFMVPDDPHYLVDGREVIMPFLKIIKNAMFSNELEIWGDPEMKRDYVHIDNLVSLIDLCSRSSLDRGTFNVGTGEAVTTEEFVKSIGHTFGREPDKINYKYCNSKRTYKCAIYDIEEQKRLLGYEPVLLKEMLEKLKKEMDERESVKSWGWV